MRPIGARSASRTPRIVRRCDELPRSDETIGIWLSRLSFLDAVALTQKVAD